MFDEINRKLLTDLQLDARTSYLELGRRAGLTTPAVIERIRKLEDAKIITKLVPYGITTTTIVLSSPVKRRVLEF